MAISPKRKFINGSSAKTQLALRTKNPTNNLINTSGTKRRHFYDFSF